MQQGETLARFHGTAKHFQDAGLDEGIERRGHRITKGEGPILGDPLPEGVLKNLFGKDSRRRSDSLVVRMEPSQGSDPGSNPGRCITSRVKVHP